MEDGIKKGLGEEIAQLVKKVFASPEFTDAVMDTVELNTGNTAVTVSKVEDLIEDAIDGIDAAELSGFDYAVETIIENYDFSYNDGVTSAAREAADEAVNDLDFNDLDGLVDHIVDVVEETVSEGKQDASSDLANRVDELETLLEALTARIDNASLDI